MTEAYLIEDGKVTAPIREGNLIGNGPEVLNQIDALGNDFAMGSPALVAKTVKGTGRRWDTNLASPKFDRRWNCGIEKWKKSYLP